MNDTLLIENYLAGALAPEESLLMEAKLLIDSELKSKADWQQHTYALVKAYGRIQLRKEIEAAHQKMFSESRFAYFRKKIAGIFQ